MSRFCVAPDFGCQFASDTTGTRLFIGAVCGLRAHVISGYRAVQLWALSQEQGYVTTHFL
jgi:hypothetical protein